jgi:hypothetical protein
MISARNYNACSPRNFILSTLVLFFALFFSFIKSRMRKFIAEAASSLMTLHWSDKWENFSELLLHGVSEYNFGPTTSSSWRREDEARGGIFKKFSFRPAPVWSPYSLSVSWLGCDSMSLSRFRVSFCLLSISTFSEKAIFLLLHPRQSYETSFYNES